MVDTCTYLPRSAPRATNSVLRKNIGLSLTLTSVITDALLDAIAEWLRLEHTVPEKPVFTLAAVWANLYS